MGGVGCGAVQPAFPREPKNHTLCSRAQSQVFSENSLGREIAEFTIPPLLGNDLMVGNPPRFCTRKPFLLTALSLGDERFWGLHT